MSEKPGNRKLVQLNLPLSNSLMKRFANQKFDDTIAPTIGIDFMPATIEIDEKAYTLSFWVGYKNNSFMLFLLVF